MSIKFDVQIIDEPSGLESVRSLAQDFLDHAQKLERECTDEKARKIFVDNSITMKNIHEVIGLKLDPMMAEGLKKHRIVISYDSQHIAQAIGIILPDYEYLPDDGDQIIKCSELCFLATAYWNIDCPNTKDEQYKTRGAGKSIVNFCIHLSRRVFLQAYESSLEFYKKFHYQVVGKEQLGLTPMLLS